MNNYVNQNIKDLLPPVQMLADEHAIIKKVLATVPNLIIMIKKGNHSESNEWILKTIEFIQKYADRFHHTKEQEILFKHFGSEPEIVDTMNKEYAIIRNHVQSAETALHSGDQDQLITHLTACTALLREHIRKEDEILYPLINQQISDSLSNLLFTQFNNISNKNHETIVMAKTFIESYSAYN
jgi:hemerythrin-like domain-containing protein